MKFTPDQQKVIDARNTNILVSAAAGSGKTAVLVERILELICDKENPVDIDRILVVTFTNAAASEMRERVENALNERLRQNPGDEHLERQSTLIHTAMITTIDSFCLYILRNNFNELGLDPGFRVGDPGELKLIRADVMEALLEDAYEKKEEDFLHFVECYATRKRDNVLEEVIQRLYDYAQSKPFPEEWLEECGKAYELENWEELSEKPWMQALNQMIVSTLMGIKDNLTIAYKISMDDDGPYMYQKALESDLEQIRSLCDCTTYTECYEKMQCISFEVLGRKSDAMVSDFKKTSVKAIRDEAKKDLEKLREQFFFASADQMADDMKKSQKTVNMLIGLTIEFGRRFRLAKSDKNMVDFSDLEHYAIQILLEKDKEEYVPSKTAKQYRDFFSFVLVDEYQDSNLVQEYLLTSIGRKRFMVGDVKQSIYKFRLAMPELFMDKYDHYPLEDMGQDNLRIDLHKNFRSRKQVVDGVNFFFSQIMQKEIGNVAYDEKAALFYGAPYEDETHEADIYATELLLVEEDSQKEITKKELEAKAVAKRIKELVGQFPIRNKKTGDVRCASYRDIVILLRTNTGWDDVFRKVLESEGIPVYIGSKTGYFSTKEIKTILDYLTVLDNPIQDIPLTGVLKSIFGGFSDSELAIIRCADKQETIYGAICAYEGKGTNDELKGKISRFMKQLEEYRDLVPFTPIHELLKRIIRDSGYYYYTGAMPAGSKRQGNLDMLLEKASAFEATSYKGLFHFVRYIELLQKYDVDFGEAGLLSENEDAVRIMSIHKSKGLEFPICILSGTSKKFNQQDMKDSILLDSGEGIGVDYVDFIHRLKSPTLLKKYMTAKMETENLGEELRVLYVAMTRAEEKLIISGTVSELYSEEGSRTGFEKKISSLSSKILYREEIPLSMDVIKKAGSFLDLILAGAIRHKGFAPVLREHDMETNVFHALFRHESLLVCTCVTAMDLVKSEMKEQITARTRRDVLCQMDTTKVCHEEMNRIMNERFTFQYPYEGMQGLYAKVSVSELKKQKQQEDEYSFRAYEEPEITPLIPAFMAAQTVEKMGAADRGTLYHKILELMDFNRCDDAASVSQFLEQLCAGGFVEKERLRLVSVSDMVTFLASPLARRMKRAQNDNRLFREQPFVMGVAANQLSEDYSAYPKEETILIQGIIDTYFEEEDGLVVVDYKTDRADEEGELIRKYSVQLAYYKDALEKLTGKRVKEKIIYSFSLGKEIYL